MDEHEAEKDFLIRRAAEEREHAEESACMVRAVHEELAEAYAARLDAIPAGAAAGDEKPEEDRAAVDRVAALLDAIRG